jgi:NAD(P)-dependent dehydrogenase (short-subunit alcohol dehydrogenase family)
MDDDPMIRETNCDPRGRRVLVTDGRSPFGQAMARGLLDAGAAQVFGGVADAWKPFPGRPAGDPVELDLTDAGSVARCAAEFGGRIDMVIHTGLHFRPGGVLERRDLVTARVEMETAYFGPMRLAQALGPAMRARGADGTHPACAWVLPVSVWALAPLPAHDAGAPAQAAALSLALALRAELRPVRVMTALLGPLDDEWHQAVPPPKVTPAAFAAAILRGLRAGLEEIAVGDVAQDALRRWQDDPSTLARELAAG